jgi:hypothetical protein
LTGEVSLSTSVCRVPVDSCQPLAIKEIVEIDDRVCRVSMALI